MKNMGQWYESIAIFNFIIDVIWCLDFVELGHFEFHNRLFGKIPMDITIFMPQSNKDGKKFRINWHLKRKYPLLYYEDLHEFYPLVKQLRQLGASL